MLNSSIAASFGITGNPSSTAKSQDRNLLNAFKTLENFVNAVTEGVKLKNYDGNRTEVVAQAITNMRANPEATWAADLLKKDVRKPQTRDQLVVEAQKSNISATILANLLGKDRDDRKAILGKCNSKVGSKAKAGEAQPGNPPSARTAGMPFGATPRMTVTTTNIYSPVDAAAHLNAISGISGAPINGNREMVGASSGN